MPLNRNNFTAVVKDIRQQSEMKHQEIKTKPDTVVRSLLEGLRQRFRDLLAIYAFGSRVSGNAGPESDLDLAILVEGKADSVALWHLAGELGDLTGCPVDLLDLRAASTVMQHRIITTGERLWARDHQADLYESFILSEKTALDEARAPLMAIIQREGTIHGR